MLFYNFLPRACLFVYRKNKQNKRYLMKIAHFLPVIIPMLMCAKEPALAPLHHDQKVTKKPLLEIKGGYFYFYDAPMKSIFKQGGASIQLAGSFPIITNLDLYSSIGFQSKSGYSLGVAKKTNYWQIPFDLGLILL